MGGEENENKFSSGFVLTCIVFLLCSVWWNVVCVLRVAELGLLVIIVILCEKCTVKTK
jgi:hypothetical protein